MVRFLRRSYWVAYESCTKVNWTRSKYVKRQKSYFGRLTRTEAEKLITLSGR